MNKVIFSALGAVALFLAFLSAPAPAIAAATNIVVTMPSLGTGNLHAACNATGFNL